MGIVAEGRVRQRVVPDLDVVTKAVAVVLEQDGAAKRREVSFCQLRVVGDDLIVERHYADLARKPENCI